MDSLPLEMKAEILGFLHPVIRLFARLVCREWRDLLPYRIPPCHVFWYLMDEDYIELVKYLVDHGYTLKLAHYADRKGNKELLNYLRDKLGWISTDYWIDENSRPWTMSCSVEEAIRYDDVRALKEHNPQEFDPDSLNDIMVDNKIEIACFMGEVMKLDPWELFQTAVSANSIICMRYFYQFLKEVPPLSEWFCFTDEYYNDVIEFFYSRGYITYEDAFFIGALENETDRLAWLRGEEKANGKLMEYHPWPEGIMLAFRSKPE